MAKITVVVLGDPSEPTLKLLDSLASDANISISKTADGLGDALAEARVLFNWSGTRAEIVNVLARAPKLEWVHARYAGLDGIMSPELQASHVPLTNGRGTFSQSLGEFVIAGALYWAKDFPRMLRAKAEHRWEVFDILELSTQTMGIVGHGDIGRAIARRAKAFGMNVLALRRDTTPRAGDEDVDKVYPNSELHAMLPECDYVVVAAPLTPTTKHMMSTSEFNCMKESAIIMNVGRGPVIDEAAMTEALRTKRIRGAALDVFEVEPLPADSALWDLDNVFISAHTSDHTKDWLNDAAMFFVEQFARWKNNEPLKNIADKTAGY
jgi:phosphoglycerate dehydrogenase-like enzyme